MTKQDFQRLSLDFEKTLSLYKTQYPKVYSEIFRKYLPWVLVGTVVVMFIMSFFGFDDTSQEGFSNEYLLWCFALSPGIFWFSWVFMKRNCNADEFIEVVDFMMSKQEDYRPKLSQIISMMDAYKEYPDVEKYIAKCRAEVSSAEDHKKQLIKKVRIITAAYFVALVAVMWSAA